MGVSKSTTAIGLGMRKFNIKLSLLNTRMNYVFLLFCLAKTSAVTVSIFLLL